MTFTANFATDIGRFRAIFPDVDADNPIFSDEEIQVFLDIEGDIRRARARGLERAANDTVMTLRVTRVLGLEVDGASAAREIRLQAQAEREEAAKAETRTEVMFDIAEMAIPPFGDREVLRNDLLRGGL